MAIMIAVMLLLIRALSLSYCSKVSEDKKTTYINSRGTFLYVHNMYIIQVGITKLTDGLMAFEDEKNTLCSAK